MCGFHGVFYNSNDVVYENNEFSSLYHRGPDDFQRKKINRLSLNFFRLKILGGDFGSQPMTSKSDIWSIAFNGEIYNYKELAREMGQDNLIDKGDTKVLIEYIDKYGLDNIHKINGMFAIVLYNHITEKLYLIRDRFGIKPLYYQFKDGNLIFASEIKSLIEKKISKKEIDSYIKSGKYPSNTSTFYKDIFEIRPGTICEINGENISEHIYYSLGNIIKNSEETSDLDYYEKLLERAIEIRLRSDVPISLHFSGGVDSTALLIKVKEVAGWDYPIGIFNLKYKGFEQLDNEFAKQICDRLKLELNEVELDPYEVPELAMELQYFQDEPYGGIPSISMYKLNQIERDLGYVVTLEGQGGDEVFGGYLSHIYLAIKDMQDTKDENTKTINNLLKLINKTNQEVIDIADRFIESGFSAHTDLTNQRNINNKKIKKNNSWLQTVQLHDIINNKIPRTMRFHDRISAACSRELRFPLLDFNVIEYSLKLSNEFKMKDGIPKYPLKNIINKHLPNHLFNKKKRADSSPQTFWLQNHLRDWSYSNLNQLKQKNIIPDNYIDEAIRDLDDKKLSNSFHIWQLINVNLMYLS